MWNLLRKNSVACRSTRDRLEEIAARQVSATRAEELFAELPAREFAHMDGCAECRQTAEDLVATRRLFLGIDSVAAQERPFFANRVMAAIAARERELANFISPWNEVPRFAYRLAWIAALVLLAGTTWIYEKGMAGRAAGGDASQESIFESQPSANQEDVLISMVEMHP